MSVDPYSTPQAPLQAADPTPPSGQHLPLPFVFALFGALLLPAARIIIFASGLDGSPGAAGVRFVVVRVLPLDALKGLLLFAFLWCFCASRILLVQASLLVAVRTYGLAALEVGAVGLAAGVLLVALAVILGAPIPDPIPDLLGYCLILGLVVQVLRRWYREFRPGVPKAAGFTLAIGAILFAYRLYPAAYRRLFPESVITKSISATFGAFPVLPERPNNALQRTRFARR